MLGQRTFLRLMPAIFLACAPAIEGRRWDPPKHVSTKAGLAEALELEVGARLEHGNDARLIHNGAVFDEIVSAIQQARTSVHIVTFIWRPSAPSDRVIEALLPRVREGVSCRLLIEKVGSNDFEEELLPKLRAAGCQVRFHEPLWKSNPGGWVERNHRKMVIVDGRVGITGGFGIWRSWLGDGRSFYQWRDDAVRVEGPAVRGMQLAFAENWRESGGGPLPSDAFPELEREGTVAAGFVASSAKEPVSGAQKMTHLLVQAARERVWIANSYFVPSDELIERMLAKRKAGVDVRVLVPGDVHDVKPVLAAQRATYQRLLEGGVRVWEYQPSMMHSKTMLIDDRVVVVGSTNVDPFSMEQAEEGSLVAVSAYLARDLEAAYLDDLRHARELTSAKTGPLQRLARRVFWFLGRNL